MTIREKDLVRYSLAYLATGDGRRARGHTRTNLSPKTTRELRGLVRDSKLLPLIRRATWVK